MGLPGAGKTTLASQLALDIGAAYFNADAVRQQFADWDFTSAGRIRQAQRMRMLCDLALDHTAYAIADFVCPTSVTRQIFQPDFVIWINTLDDSIYADTNDLFEPPARPDYRVDRRQPVIHMVAAIRSLLDKNLPKSAQ